MNNQIYRVDMSSKKRLEFYIAETNVLGTDAKVKEREIGVVLLGKNVQYDGSLNLDELESLIKYLTDCKEDIEYFNQKQLKA